MINPIAGLVLAGGAARRMGGGDKALLVLGGTTVLARLLARLALQRTAISANGDPSRYAAYGLPVLPDGRFAGEGPLAGVLAGLEWADGVGAEALLTVPGDTPFLPCNLAERLYPAPSRAEAGGRAHHLVALWPVGCRTALRALLSRPGPRHVGRFADSLGMRPVLFPDEAAFLNLNTPHDLAAARARVGDCFKEPQE